jgi:hypothetical protein
MLVAYFMRHTAIQIKIDNMNNTILPGRLVISAKDIQNIIGCSERTARRIMARIRKQTGRGRGSYISIEEFCQDTGLEEMKVAGFLR